MSGDALRERTEQKLRFADLHLREVAGIPGGRGHDFERAHHEAVLVQLIGAYDALLAELNVIFGGCGNPAKDISLNRLRKSLAKQGRSSAALARLHELREHSSEWLSKLLALRNASVHKSGVPMVCYAGGDRDGVGAFRNPETREELPDDALDTLRDWLPRMRALTTEMRALAASEAAEWPLAR